MSVYPTDGISEDEKRERLDQLVQQLAGKPEIEAIALGSGNAAYTGSTSSTSIEAGNVSVDANIFHTHHAAYFEAMDFKLTEGRWFNEQDLASRYKPVVVTQNLKDQLFGKGPAVGKLFNNQEFQVIGVIEAYKARGDFAENVGSYFHYNSISDTTSDLYSATYIRVKPGTSMAFEEEIIKITAAICPGWTFNLRPMENMRESYMTSNLIPIVILLVVSIFLVLNVVLGLYGVLWQSINVRYSEIGLRRAIDASSGDIYKQFLGEIIVLATFGLILGCFFAVQFPLLGVFNLPSEVYVLAILASVLIIYLLVILCALYPSRQAASIHPAVALHQE